MRYLDHAVAYIAARIGAKGQKAVARRVHARCCSRGLVWEAERDIGRFITLLLFELLFEICDLVLELLGIVCRRSRRRRRFRSRPVWLVDDPVGVWVRAVPIVIRK